MNVLRVAIAGLGRAGRAVAWECSDADGVELVGAWNRGPVTDIELLDKLGSQLVTGGTTPPIALQDVDLLLLAIGDRAVPEVAARLTPPPETAVVHLSGAADASLLDALPSGHAGCWHPLQAFAGGRPPAGAPPYAVALQGAPEAVARGQILAHRLGHPCAELAADGRAAYHASAVLASNCLVALEATALRVMESAGVSAADGWRLLWPLVAGTLQNLEPGPSSDTLTGPVARGDGPTVLRNLGALRDDPSATAVYLSLSREALALAAEGGLDKAAIRAIDDLLALPAKEE